MIMSRITWMIIVTVLISIVIGSVVYALRSRDGGVDAFFADTMTSLSGKTEEKKVLYDPPSRFIQTVHSPDDERPIMPDDDSIQPVPLPLSGNSVE